MTLVPIRPKLLPSSTATFVNGSPPPDLLRDPGDGLGSLLVPCSYGMQAMHLWALQHGSFVIETTGRGRPLAQQTALFLARMTPSYDAAVNTIDDQRVCQLDQHMIHPQLVPGHRWYKRRGVAACASPGTSNHGWFCADDMSQEYDGDPATDPITEACVEFLIPIAHLFGWTWEMQSERWHVVWMAGDTIPPLAQQVLHDYGIPFPGDQPEPPGDNMSAIDPIRLLDTRQLGGPAHVGQVVVLTPPGRPADANGVVVNVTATQTEGPGFVTVWRGGTRPETSNVNYSAAGQTVANVAVVPLADDGSFTLSPAASACHLIVDLQGWA